MALIFLPLTFITSLLGMNVQGIPYANHPDSFWVITIFCVLVGIVAGGRGAIVNIASASGIAGLRDRAAYCAAKAGMDLPRGAGNTQAKKRKAVIPDLRNDENLAVAQHHAAMIRFHNRIVDTLPSATPAAVRFRRARRRAVLPQQTVLRFGFTAREVSELANRGVLEAVQEVREAGRVIGDVVSTMKDVNLTGLKLLILQPIAASGEASART